MSGEYCIVFGFLNSPPSIGVVVGDRCHDDGDDGADDGGHAVEVVHAARVMELQLLLKERLGEGEEERRSKSAV